jgi:hypothetical protein
VRLGLTSHADVRPMRLLPSYVTVPSTSGSPSEAQLGSSVVLPGLVDSYVGSEGGKGAVKGLMGDRSIRGASEMGAGHKASAKTVGAVVGWVEPES